MGEKIKEIIAKIFGIRTQVIVTPTEQQQLDDAVEKERGALHGEVVRRKLKEKELSEQLGLIEKEKIKESAIRLNQKKEEISNENLIGGCDWRALFNEIEKKKLKIKVLSYNLKKDFGIFDTIVTDKKGMRNLFVKDTEGNRRRIITGLKDSNIFRFPFGISKMAQKGIFIINLDENGEYVTDPLLTEIPNLIMDSKGKLELSRIDQEPFIDRYIKVTSELAEAHAQIETYEKTISDLIRKENLTRHQLNIAKSRAETSESELSANIKKITEMNKVYSDVIYRGSLLSQQLDIAKKQNESYDAVVKEIMEKLDEAKTRTKLEDAKDLIEDTLSMLNNLRPQNQEVIVEPKNQSKFEEKMEKLERGGKRI